APEDEVESVVSRDFGRVTLIPVVRASSPIDIPHKLETYPRPLGPGLSSAHLAHSRASSRDAWMTERGRPLRARLVTSHSGGSGAPLGRHYGRSARSSLDWDRASALSWETRPGADGGTSFE